MENRAHAIVAVVFLAVFSLGAIIVYAWLANREPEPLAYRIVTMQSVGGLAPQSEVRFKGLVVGHVTRIRFDPTDRAQVVIDLHLRAHTYVTHATYAEVAMQGLAGGSMLELKLGAGSRTLLTTSREHPAEIPLRAGGIGALLDTAPQVVQNLNTVLRNANQLLAPANRQHLAASLAQLDSATRELAVIEAQLPPLIAGLQQSVAQSHALLADTDRLARKAAVPVAHAAALEESIQALAISSRALSRRLDAQSVPDFAALSANLERTSTQLDALLRELKAKPQSLLLGPPRPPPGPGEPGFKRASKEPSR